MLAVGLLAALTYSYVKDSKENITSQNAVQVAETLYSQINMIKSAVVECVDEYPGGGGDMNNDGVIDTSDNANNPYPLNPSNALNLKAVSSSTNPATNSGCSVTGATGCIPQEASGYDYVSDLYCIGAPPGAAAMFSGTSNQGRYIPPPPTGFNDTAAPTGWVYKNNSTFGGAGGVYIQITGDGSPTASVALTRLLAQFTTKQASVAGNTLTVWIQNNN